MKSKEEYIGSHQDKRIKELSSMEHSMKKASVDVAAVERRFDALLESKMKVATTVEKLSKEKKELFNDLSDLLNKINALTISTKEFSINDKIQKIKALFMRVETREEGFRKNVSELSGMLDGMRKTKTKKKK